MTLSRNSELIEIARPGLRLVKRQATKRETLLEKQRILLGNVMKSKVNK